MQSSETVLRLNQAQCWFVGYKEAKKKEKKDKIKINVNSKIHVNTILSCIEYFELLTSLQM